MRPNATRDRVLAKVDDSGRSTQELRSLVGRITTRSIAQHLSRLRRMGKIEAQKGITGEWFFRRAPAQERAQ